MAKIQISELSPVDESSLNELTDEQMVNLKGGSLVNKQFGYNNFNNQQKGGSFTKPKKLDLLNIEFYL